MDEDAQQAAGAGARRRRLSLRQRLIAAGLVELKEWVREADATRAYALLDPLVEAGRQQFARHDRQSRGEAVAVAVSFSGVPPAVFREQLRQEWGLEWDRAARCWRGTLGSVAVGRLQEFVIPYWGTVEADQPWWGEAAAASRVVPGSARPCCTAPSPNMQLWQLS